MKNSYLFIVLVLLTIGINLISKQLINSERLIMDSLLEYYSYEQVESFFNTQQRLKWIGLLITPLLLIIKTLLISTIIDVGCFFYDYEIKFKRILNIVLKAEFVFLLVTIFKIGWFYFFQTDYNLEDLQYFYPLSALSIIGYEGLQPWFIYPFQVLNLFELAYWVILAYLIGKELNENTDKGFSIIASSYGISLLIWVVGVMFFTLNMS